MADAQLIAQLKLDASQYNKEMKNATDAAKSAAHSIDNTSAEINKLGSQSNQSAGYLKSLTGAVIGYVSAQKLIAASDEWTTLNNRIRLVTSTQAEFAAAQSSLVSISQGTGQALNSIGSTYQALARSQKELGLTQKEVLQLTDTISKTMVIGGGTAEGNAAALIQLSQAFSSGVLRGEEFNSVMEQAPALAKTMAEGLGVPVGALRQMANDGKLTADVVTKALMKMKDSVDTQFKTMNLTISQSFEVLKTGFTQFIGQTNEATGAARIISAAIQTMGKNVDVAASALLTFAAVGVVPYLYAGTTAVVGFSAAAVTSATSVRSLSAALAMLRSAAVSVVAALGPLGIAAAAAAAVAAYIGLSKESDNVNASLVSQASAVKELKAAYAELAPYQKGAAFDEINKQLITANQNITKLRQNAPNALMVNDASLNKALQDAQDGVTTVSASLGELNKNEFFKENSKEVMQWAADYDMARGEVERLNRSLDVLNGKQEESIKKSVYLDFDTSTSAPSASAVQIQADITGISKQFTDLGANIGLSSEQIKLNTANQKIADELAKTGNSEATIAVLKRAEADVQGAQAALDKYNADKAAADEVKKKTELEAQNARYVQDTIEARIKEAESIGMTKEQLLALELSAKGATAEQIKQATEAQKLTDTYQRQNAVMQTLESIMDSFKTAGMSGIEKQLYQLQKQGATREQLEMAKKYLEATEVINETSREQSRNAKEAKRANDSINETQKQSADTMLEAANLMNGAANKEDVKDAQKTPQIQMFTGAPSKANASEFKAGGEAKNLGEFTLNLATEKGLAASFPMLGSVKSIDDLRNFFNQTLQQYAMRGSAANS